MTIIIGIDPGSRETGYGLIEVVGQKSKFIDAGTVQLKTGNLAERLTLLHRNLLEIIEYHQPTEFAIEEVFMGKNASSALKLGHARGAAMLTGQLSGCQVYEYAARQVKQALVGRGAADKSQVRHMVKILLCLGREIDDFSEDASDALAIALCHAHTQQTANQLARSAAKYQLLNQNEKDVT